MSEETTSHIHHLRQEDPINYDRWYSILVITSSCCIALYTLFLVWTLVNTKLYVCDQKRYKTFSVLIFYVLAVVILTSRIAMYFNVLTIYGTVFDNWPYFWKVPFVYNFFYVVTMFVTRWKP